MTATNSKFKIFRNLRDQRVTTDPDADAFFTVMDGEPVTFGEFNARMAEDFEHQKRKGDRYE